MVVWRALCVCASATQVVLLDFLTDARVHTHIVLATARFRRALF